MEELPLDLIRPIWVYLDEQSAQHSLRCASRQLRDATSPFITSLCLLGHRYASGEQEWLEGLSRFPAQATLKTLRAKRKATLSTSMEKNRNPAPTEGWLAGFLAGAGSRLRCLERLELGGDIWRGYELCVWHTQGMTICLTETISRALVSASPMLRCLGLSCFQTEGTAFTPLASLPCLSQLSLTNMFGVALAGSAATVLQSLSGLTTLTELVVKQFLGGPCILPALPEALILLSGMTSLVNLSLQVPLGTEPTPGVAALCRMSRLSSLTLAPRSRWEQHGERMPSVLGAVELAQLSNLVSLQLPETELDAASLERLAVSMPHVTSLEALTLDPGKVDCSRLPCNWRRLKLRLGPSHQSYKNLPLAAVEHMEVERHIWSCTATEWQEDCEQVSDVRKAAEQVVRLSGNTPVNVALEGFGGELPVVLIHGLRPLHGLGARGFEQFELSLPFWFFTAAAAYALHDTLPLLQSLDLSRCSDFDPHEVYGALASLSSLRAVTSEGSEWTPKAVRELAQRWASDRPLEIRVRSWDPEGMAGCIALLLDLGRPDITLVRC